MSSKEASSQVKPPGSNGSNATRLQNPTGSNATRLQNALARPQNALARPQNALARPQNPNGSNAATGAPENPIVAKPGIFGGRRRRKSRRAKGRRKSVRR
jgi:hypothetical protein